MAYQDYSNTVGCLGLSRGGRTGGVFKYIYGLAGVEGMGSNHGQEGQAE
jgi:hypothetical protein